MTRRIKQEPLGLTQDGFTWSLKVSDRGVKWEVQDKDVEMERVESIKHASIHFSDLTMTAQAEEDRGKLQQRPGPDNQRITLRDEVVEDDFQLGSRC